MSVSVSMRVCGCAWVHVCMCGSELGPYCLFSPAPACLRRLLISSRQALTSVTIVAEAVRPLGQASLLTVLAPGSNVSALTVTWSVQGSGQLVVVNASTASFTATSAGPRTISVHVCSSSTCLNASYAITVAALLEQLTVSAPTFGVPLGSATTLSIATTAASLATCVVTVDGTNHTASFSAEASALDFSFTVANPGAHLALVSCANMHSQGTPLMQSQLVVVIGSLFNVSASLVQVALTLPVGSVGNLTTVLEGDTVVLGNGSSFSTALVWRNSSAVPPSFTSLLDIEVSLANLDFSWGTVLVSGPSTLLALPFVVLTTIPPQWSSVSAAGLAITGQPVPFAPILAAGSLPANITLFSGASGVANVTNISQTCIQAGCASALAGCPQPAACLCAVTCPQCACAWPAVNMVALETLFACTRTLSCPVSVSYAAAGRFNMTFKASNALGQASGLTTVTVQQPITSASIVGASFVAINTTIVLTSLSTGSNQRYQWTMNGTAVGTGSSLSRRFLSQGSVIIILTVSNNISSVTTQTTLVVQDTARLQSLECPPSATVGATVVCVANAINVFHANISWFVNNQRVLAGVDGFTLNLSSATAQRAMVKIVVTNAFSTSSKEVAVDYQQPLTFLTLAIPSVTVGSSTNVTPAHVSAFVGLRRGAGAGSLFYVGFLVSPVISVASLVSLSSTLSCFGALLSMFPSSLSLSLSLSLSFPPPHPAPPRPFVVFGVELHTSPTCRTALL
jgi:hypothetical protein